MTAFGASEEMCKRVSEYIGQEVEKILLQDVTYKDEFDGIMASASLFHLSMEGLPVVLIKMHDAFKRKVLCMLPQRMAMEKNAWRAQV